MQRSFTDRLLRKFLLAAFAPALALSLSAAIYYLKPGPGTALQLARVNSDGSNDQLVPLPLPQPSFPAWSKDGALLTLTSVDPQRPAKISQDVFLLDPATGNTRLVVPFVDETTVEPVFSGGVYLGDRNKFTYVVPLFKAFSPDRSRLAVSSLITSGFYQTQQPVLDQLSGTSQVPMLRIYRVADGFPAELIVLGRVRTFFTLGGFGVDWHPTQNLLAAPIDVDAPTIGSTAPSESSAIFLVEAVANAVELGRGRQLTHPTGTLVSDLFNLSGSVETDYAPAFSPDGQRVAYLRAVNTTDFVQGVAQARPVSVALRMVNLDGSNDHVVLTFAAGIFVNQVSWSPDGRQLVFDAGRQPTPQPLALARLEALPETLELHVVNQDGSNPHQLLPPAAGLPAWRPGPAETGGPEPTPRMTVALAQGTPPKLVLTWPAGGPGKDLKIEESERLGAGANWRPVVVSITSNGNASTASVAIGAGARYFRLAIP